MSEKKRIAVLINSSSGLYSFRRELLEALVERKFDIPDEQ